MKFVGKKWTLASKAYLLSHFHEYSWIAMKQGGVETCYEDVTSNSSENMWYHAAALRHLPIHNMVRKYISLQAEKATRSRQVAEERY